MIFFLIFQKFGFALETMHRSLDMHRFVYVFMYELMCEYLHACVLRSSERWGGDSSELRSIKNYIFFPLRLPVS